MKLLPILLIFLAACGGGNFEEVEKSNLVKNDCEYIDENLIEFEYEEIFYNTPPITSFKIFNDTIYEHEASQAIEMWNDALDVNLFSLTNSIEQSIYITSEYELISDNPEEDPVAIAIPNHKEYECKIVIFEKFQGLNYKKIIAHELGHCLGLSHDIGNPDSIISHGNCFPDYLVDLVYERYNL